MDLRIRISGFSKGAHEENYNEKPCEETRTFREGAMCIGLQFV